VSNGSRTRLSSGREYQKNDPAVTVDYNTADPVVRWDSYENFNQRHQDGPEGNAPLGTPSLSSPQSRKQTVGADEFRVP